MKECVILLDDKYKNRLALVRTVADWKAAADDNQIWLRGPADGGMIPSSLSSLPATATYFMDERLRLFPRGKQTPVSTLKALEWQSLSVFIPLSLPVSALPGIKPARIAIRLSRSTQIRATFALMTTMGVWKAYVEAAPLIRLQQLRFAVSTAGRVLITGQPLPPIKGTRYWLCKNSLVPAGYEFDPPILGDLINSNDMDLFDVDGCKETIPLSAFNPAERNLVRQND